MSIYKEFAYIYDELMMDVPYDKWIEFVLENRSKGNKLLELGCGTGNMGLSLAQNGLFATLTDISEDMLTVAGQKAREENINNIQLMLQDMSNISIKGSFDNIISFCDGINYLLTEDEIRNMFSRIKEISSAKARIFIEFSTKYKLSQVISNKTITEDNEDISFVWKNSYDSNKDILNFNIKFKVVEDSEVISFEENHIQRGWEPIAIQGIASEYFKVLFLLDSESLGNLHENSERCLICMENI